MLELSGGDMTVESAQQVAGKRRVGAAQVVDTAEVFERDPEGEEATARVLSTLPVKEWRVYQDMPWPGRRFASIDHVVVGPPGVFVIDSRFWEGTLEVGDGVLRQNGRDRVKAAIPVAEAAAAVLEMIPGLHEDLVAGVLCLVGPEPLSGTTNGVTIRTTANLIETLTACPPVLDDAAIADPTA